MKRYENIEDAICKELDKLDKKYAGGSDLSVQDLETIRLLYSAKLKSETLYAMEEEREWDDEDMEGSGEGRMSRGGRSYGRYGTDRSYRRGRDAMGRYTSMDMDGWSGHYPEWMPPYPRY